nr:PAS4 Protein [Schizosaccharomyces pombe]
MGEEAARIVLAKQDRSKGLVLATTGERMTSLIFSLVIDLVGVHVNKLLKQASYSSSFKLPFGLRNLLPEAVISKEKHLVYILNSFKPILLKLVSIIRFLCLTMKGHCATVSQLLLGLKYISLDEINPEEKKKVLTLLLLLGSRLIASILQHSNSYFDQHTISSITDERDLEDKNKLPFIPEGNRKCSLCMEFIHCPAATECGHIFCWSCINGWTSKKSECPLCRAFSSPSKIILLRYSVNSCFSCYNSTTSTTCQNTQLCSLACVKQLLFYIILTFSYMLFLKNCVLRTKNFLHFYAPFVYSSA